MNERTEGLYCPRCDKKTNQRLELLFNDEIPASVNDDAPPWVRQRCENCDLERVGIINWGIWTVEKCKRVPWHKNSKDDD